MDEHRIEIPLPKEEALAAVGSAAEMWGAKWRREGSGGWLTLPVTAGIRRGELQGRVWTEPAGVGTRLIFGVEKSSYRVHLQAAAILTLGALGGLVVMLWPFYPPLLGIAPLAALLALVAWLLVASRLRSAGAEEFFEIVALPEEELPPEERKPEPPPKAIQP